MSTNRRNIYLILIVFVALALLWSLTAGATTAPQPTSPKNDVKSTAGAHAGAHADARSTSQSRSSSSARGGAARSTSTASGGRATAAGGEGGEAFAAAGDNLNTVDASQYYEDQRDIPMMVMGIVAPNDCGAGGQAGGAGTNGAGFLGFAWTTKNCYALKTGAAFAAAGDYELACELWVAANRKMLAKTGVGRINCAERARAMRMRDVQYSSQRDAEEETVTFTRRELEERDRRMMQRVGK
jgi:hypothetical protein